MWTNAASDARPRLAVSVVGHRTAFDDRGQTYTLYDLQCSRDSKSWKTAMRYSDMKKLSQALSERHKSSGIQKQPPPSIPDNIGGVGGWMAGLNGSASPEFVRKRAAGLQGWFEALAQVLPEDDPLLLSAFNAPRTPAASSAVSPGASEVSTAGPSSATAASNPTPDRTASRAPGAGAAEAPAPAGSAAATASLHPPQSSLTWELVWEAGPD